MARAKAKPAARKGTRKPARTPRPAGPVVRGRRGQPAVDQQKGLRDYIDAMLREVPRPTYDEMIERIKGTGFYISRSSLARHGLKFELQKGELRLFAEQSKQLRSENPDDVLAVEDAITGLINTRMLRGLLEEDQKLTKEDIALAFAHARLQSSSAQRERVRLAVTRGVNAAVRLIKAEVAKLLEGDKDLVRRIHALVDRAQHQLTAGGAA